MRQIGALPDEPAARLFGDFLFMRGIENEIEPDKDHGCIIWVHEDDKLERAAQLLAEYRAEPSHPRFAAQAAGATEARAQTLREKEAYAKKVRSAHQVFAPLYGHGFGPVTLALILISIAVAIIGNLGNNHERIMSLFITEFQAESGYITWMKGLPEIRDGQVWRLITPIFIHFGFLHIFFNMLWLRDLGSALEMRHGPWFLSLQVLVIAIVSNLAQFFLASPNFGGMSGVVYGLLGYIWIRGKYDFNFGLALHTTTVMMMTIWFVLCWAGLLGSIANWCHTAGLLTGMAWGYIAARLNR